MHLMVLVGDVVEVEAHFSPFGDNVNLDARYVNSSTECSTGMEIVLDVLDGTLGDVGQGEACFSQFGESVRLDAR